MINFLKLGKDEPIIWLVTLGQVESTEPGYKIPVIAKDAITAVQAALNWEQDEHGPQDGNVVLGIECVGGAILNAM